MRYRFFNLINILGLSIGLASSFIILLYINNELGYDQYHFKKNQIYRLVYSDTTSYDTIDTWDMTPSQLAGVLKNDFPEIIESARIYNSDLTYIRKNDDFVKEKSTLKFIDVKLFKIFTIPITSGNKKNTLTDPNSIMISEKASLKYFAEQNPIGKELEMIIENKPYRFIVEGVYHDIPFNSTFRADFIGNIGRIEKDVLTSDWDNISCQTYILLRQDSKPGDIQKKLPTRVTKYHQKESVSYSLQNIEDIYLYSDFSSWCIPTGSLKNIYLLAGIAILTLLLACFNYIIMSTAQAETRYKEIGVRKIIGADRRSLVPLLLSESFFVSFIVFPTALVFTELLLRYINQKLNTQFGLSDIFNLKMITLFIFISLLVGVFSGSYISFYLTSCNPLQLLYKRIRKNGKSKVLFRNGLIVIQLIIFLLLFVSTLVVKEQLTCVYTKDYGFEKNNLIVIDCAGLGFESYYSIFKNEVYQIPGITSVISASTGLFTDSQSGAIVDHIEDPEKQIISLLYNVDPDYLRTLEFEFLSGRNFSNKFKTDSSAVIINELLQNKAGIINPLNQTIQIFERNHKVIGVVRNFKAISAKHDYIPYVFMLKSPLHEINQVIIRIENTQPEKTLSLIKDKWNSIVPDKPMEVKYMNNIIEDMYEEESLWSNVLSIFSFLSILIASTGLTGLSAFIAQQKTKEIGIRKVLGADILEILQFITSKYVKIVVLANTIALPVAWYFTDKWLQNYTFRVHINVWIFLIGFLLL